MGLLNFIFYSLTHYEKSLISKRTTKMVKYNEPWPQEFLEVISSKMFVTLHMF